jgi:hypothetical protein
MNVGLTFERIYKIESIHIVQVKNFSFPSMESLTAGNPTNASQGIRCSHASTFGYSARFPGTTAVRAPREPGGAHPREIDERCTTNDQLSDGCF